MTTNLFNPTLHVSFPHLGTHGRFGNQLFQIAATIAHARRLGLKALFSYSAWFEGFSAFGLDVRDFLVTDMVESPRLEYCHEAEWNYAQIPSAARLLHGYFQSPLWWNGSCPLKPPIIGEPTVPLVAHIRRGDYLQVPFHHPPLPEHYYRDAARLEGNPRGVEVGLDLLRLGGWDQRKPVSLMDDFFFLCQAEALVISNSSFAIWAGYLGRAKRVYYPRPWFGHLLAGHDAEQMIPADTPDKLWIPIDWGN